MPALCARRSVGMPPRSYFRLRAFGALLLVVVAGVNAQTTGGTSCQYLSSGCQSTPCPGTDAETVTSCIVSTPPCPTGCKEKTVAGTTTALCALASASSAPYDAANTATFLECIQETSTTSADDCSTAYTEHFAAAGCDIDCRIAWNGRDSRGDVCALETTETACEAKTVPCGPDVSSGPAEGPTQIGPPSSGQGTNDSGEDLGYCNFNERTGNCQQPFCPNHPFVTWQECAFSSPPCPEVCAEKPVAGAEGVTICAVVGSEIDPIDRATAQAFVECFGGTSNSDDPQCPSVFSEYARATGCSTDCFAALSEGPRNEICEALPDNDEETCVSTRLTDECPTYPEPAIAGESPPPPPSPPSPPIGGDDGATGPDPAVRDAGDITPTAGASPPNFGTVEESESASSVAAACGATVLAAVVVALAIS